LDAEAAHLCAHDLCSLIFAEADVNNAKFTENEGGMMGGSGGMMGGGYGSKYSLDPLLTEASPAQIACREPIMAMSSVRGSACFSVPSAIVAAASIGAQPFPCRLTTQELVELLKMPTCFGPARRVVLDHLGNRYGPQFKNHWAFVRYAREQKLGLDFTTPPRRPDPRQSVERMLQALGGPDVKR
jgi:hypothetical protein